MVILALYIPISDCREEGQAGIKRVVHRLNEAIGDPSVKIIAIPSQDRTSFAIEVVYPKFVIIDEGQISELMTGLKDLTALLESQVLPT